MSNAQLDLSSPLALGSLKGRTTLPSPPPVVSPSPGGKEDEEEEEPQSATAASTLLGIIGVVAQLECWRHRVD